MEIGYYCPKCNKVYSTCWELQGVNICSTCFDEGHIKLITLENFRDHLNVIPLRDDALKYFKNKYVKNQQFPSKFTEKEKNKIITILNKGLRKEKLKKIFENIQQNEN